MDFVVQNHSGYPRSDEPGEQRWRGTEGLRERERISAAELAMIERTLIDKTIHEQENAGVDVVTDGQIRWRDPVWHVMGKLDGVHTKQRLRYFDTDRSFLQPIVTAALRRCAPMLLDDYALACLVTARRVKPVLLGPYTLAQLSVIESGPYRDVAALAHALSEVLSAEVADLVHAGAPIIQIDEPAILAHPQDIRLLRELLEPLWMARGRAQLMLATYFGDAESLYAQLNSVPADIIAFDVASAPKLAEIIATTGASKVLALGLVDGRNARLESAQLVAKQVETMLARYTIDSLHILPSCGLDALPRHVALAKLELLAQIRAMVWHA